MAIVNKLFMISSWFLALMDYICLEFFGNIGKLTCLYIITKSNVFMFQFADVTNFSHEQ